MHKLVLIIWLAAVAEVAGQGQFFLNNRTPGSQAPFVLFYESTGDVVSVTPPAWRLEVRAGPIAAASAEELEVLQPAVEFRTSASGGGFVVPTVYTVPKVPAGAEATVQLALFKTNQPGARIPVGSYTVRLAGRAEVPPSLELGNRPIRIPVTRELTDLFPIRPPIPGEPVHDEKPLSYWLGCLDLMSVHWTQNPRSFEQGQKAIAALGLAAIPFILQYEDSRPFRSDTVIRSAMMALIANGKEEEVDRLILEFLDSTNGVVRKNALVALSCAAAREHEPRLIQIIEGEAGELRRTALARLSGCGLTNSVLLPIWTELLGSDDRNDVAQALSGLAQFKDAAEPALPRIRTLVEEAEPHTRLMAARALWAITRETNVIGIVFQMLRNERGYPVVGSALRLLGEIGPPAKALVPEIIRTIDQLQDQPRIPGPILIREAREALQRIDPGSEEQLPAPRRPPFRMGPGLMPFPGPGQPPPPTMMPFG